MTINTEVQNCINALDNTCSGQSILLSAIGATETTNRSVSVPSADDLPDLVTNSISNGTTVYVVDLNSYFVANGTSWIGLDDKVVRSDTGRELYAWGLNTCGKLGDGTTTCRLTPTQEITAATNWCTVSAGGGHTAAIKTTGALYSWGCNNQGQLGVAYAASGANSYPYQESTSAINWCAVATKGLAHTAAVKTTGELYAWGCNGNGQLGDGTVVNKSAPTQESTAATNWCAVTVGYAYTAAVKTTGALYAWGSNTFGLLGDGTTVAKCVPTQESTAATNWCAVSAGTFHTAAIKTNGTLYAWGYNPQGSLGDGTTVAKCVPTQECTAATNWCAVSLGGYHTAAVKTNGELYAWGEGNFGRLGNGTTADKCVPTQESTAATDWCAVTAGQDHTAAIKTTGALYAWGDNGFGQLGDGTVVDKCVPTQESTAATDWCAVSAGDYYTAAIKRPT